MGLFETAGRFPELVLQRRRLARHLLSWRPDVFVGIDAPNYNLALERRLRAAGIPTVHYVSPSVWAWRRYRLPRIARSTDLVLTLFPFEAAFYHEHGVPARFVGHPTADYLTSELDDQLTGGRLEAWRSRIVPTRFFARGQVGRCDGRLHMSNLVTQSPQETTPCRRVPRSFRKAVARRWRAWG